MVLCSAQFQQSDLAGGTFLTGPALFSSSTALMQGRSNAVRLSQGTHRRLMPLHGGDQCRQSHKGLASYGAGG
jgi:hypothetical protein